MCGICGVAHADATAEVPRETLSRMRRALTHRGPDGHGERCESGVGLAHTRLSIIDVAGGQQPMRNEDGTVWITFNGEIYNYQPLRERLQEQGHVFRTKSDTEVLVHLYEEKGPDLVHELNGMFAFAIHDTRRQRVVLARDHFGIKPLFYAERDGTLYFGSEVKSVLAGLESSGETTTAAVQEYLLFGFLTEDRSFFRGVKRLPPGSTAIWEDGRLTVKSFWMPSAPEPSHFASIDAAADALELQLDASVRAQMMSEVPLGTFCSGGVDSGLVSAFAARGTRQHFHTFSVGFADPAWDETALATETSHRIGSHHHVLIADSETFRSSLPDAIRSNDEPLLHQNSVLIAQLSAMAKEHVTVVLTGEGSDEIFDGYPRHHIARANAVAQHWPHWLRRTAAFSLNRLGGRKSHLLGSHLDLSFADAVVLNSAKVASPLVERLTGSAPTDAIGTRSAMAETLTVRGDAGASISRYDQRAYLPCLLDRLDRMTMASGLEGRVPFLDVKLVEWARQLPALYRLGFLGNKRVVKELGARYLSQATARGPKSGFGVPVGDWMLTPEWAPLVGRLRDPSHPATAMLDAREVRALVDAHFKGVPGLADVLWLLLNVYLWHENRSEA